MNKLIVALFAATSLSAYAGTAGPVKLKNLHFMPNGTVIAYIDGPRSSAPTCATESSRFAVPATSAGGKVQLAGLLMAYTTGRPVTIYGTGTCAAWGDTESIDFFLTLD
jgi:hypothetical protein